jgi:hypothetical protein
MLLFAVSPSLSMVTYCSILVLSPLSPGSLLLFSTTVVSGQINPDWDCLQANHMLSSFKTDNLIGSF